MKVSSTGAFVVLALLASGCGARSGLEVAPPPARDAAVPGVARATRFVDVAAGRTHSCAVTDVGTVWCWGSNRRLELGIGETERTSFAPTRVPGLDDALRVSADAATCAVRATGAVLCWGSGEGYLFGPDVALDVGEPRPIDGVTAAVDVTVGNGHACVLDRSGGVTCWGHNACGQLGREPADGEWRGPAEVPGLRGVAQVSAGSCHTCAATVSGQTFCWGNNTSGQLGVPGDGGSRPRLVSSLRAPVDMDAPAGCTCASGASGAACWGSGIYGALGVGDTRSRSEPTPVVGPGAAVAVSTNCASTCTAYADGSLWCWGSSSFGSLGEGREGTELTPVLHAGASDVVLVSAGLEHFCAVLASGEVVCWGRGQHAQLGDGREEHHGMLTTLRAAEL